MSSLVSWLSYPELFPTAPCKTSVCQDILDLYLASGNTSVAPCTDFFSFACGNINRTGSSFQALAEENRRRVRRILGKGIRMEGSRAGRAVEPGMVTTVPPKPVWLGNSQLVPCSTGS